VICSSSNLLFLTVRSSQPSTGVLVTVSTILVPNINVQTYLLTYLPTEDGQAELI